MAGFDYEVVIKEVPALLVAAIRMKGKYSDCGEAFARIGKALGRYLLAPPLCLYYDREYRENDADFEPCIPIERRRDPVPGDIAIRELPGGRFVTLVHRGAYDSQGPSYDRILDYIEERGLDIGPPPTRAVFLKGPGRIFQGNPKDYLTEIQFPLA